MAIGDTTVRATVSRLKSCVDPRTSLPTPARMLDCGAVGVCNLDLAEAIPLDRGRRHFTLIDHPAETVGIGRLHFALYRSQNVRWQSLDIDKRARAEADGSEAVRRLVHRAYPALASPQSRTSSRNNFTPSGDTRISLTAITCVTDSTRISASPTPTASKTSGV